MENRTRLNSPSLLQCVLHFLGVYYEAGQVTAKLHINFLWLYYKADNYYNASIRKTLRALLLIQLLLATWRLPRLLLQYKFPLFCSAILVLLLTDTNKVT